MYVGVFLPVYLCTTCVSSSTEARRGVNRLPRNGVNRQSWADRWLLRFEPGSWARAVSALKPWTRLQSQNGVFSVSLKCSEKFVSFAFCVQSQYFLQTKLKCLEWQRHCTLELTGAAFELCRMKPVKTPAWLGAVDITGPHFSVVAGDPNCPAGALSTDPLLSPEYDFVIHEPVKS